MYDFKPQKRWSEKANNTILSVSPPPEALPKVRGVLAAHTDYLAYFMERVGTWPCLKQDRSPILVETQEQLNNCLEQLQKQATVCFQVYNEDHRSYKGFCTWVVFCSPAGTYLVDMLKLRQFGHELAKVFDDIRIAKVGIDIEKQLQWLQRDFSVFSANVFDFKEIFKHQNLSVDSEKLSIQLFEEPITKPRSHLYRRPPTTQDIKHLSCTGQLPYRILTDCHRLFLEYPIQSVRKAYYMSNLLCQRGWQHHPTTLAQLQLQVFSGKQNVQREDSQVKIGRLHRWREYIAKMHDESVDYILPARIIQKILQRGVKSILELTTIYSQWNQKEVCKQHHYDILEMLNEPKPKLDPEQMQAETDKLLDNPQQLFRQIGWQDKQWKSNHFQSMKLFKQILSMNIVQPSIIDPELNTYQDRHISNQELTYLFKYSECFSNNDVQLLNHYYDQMIGNQQNHQRNDQMDGSNNNSSRDHFPETISEIYELANRKKKEMKKEKKRSNEDKEEVFSINVKEFCKKIGFE